MTGLDIDTGGTLIVPPEARSESRPVQSTHKILFDAASTFLQSDLIIVRENQAFMLIGYSVPDGAIFTANAVSVGSRQMPNGGGCCIPGGVSVVSSSYADILFREPMTVGGHEWKIDTDHRQLILVLPGTYQLLLNDEQYLGSVHVELVDLGMINTRLPDSYLAGVGE